MDDIEDKVKGKELQHPAAPPLPDTREGFAALRMLKQKRTLNDMVEDLLFAEWENPKFQVYFDAVWDEQAQEGSVNTDLMMAAIILRERAKKTESPVANEKIKTIVKAIRVVLDRHGSLPEQRRRRLGGVTNSSNNETNTEE